MTDKESARYWLNGVVEEIVKKHPEGEIIVSSGVSPSGPYHIGSLREILTADAIAYALRKAGRDSTHLHFVDDFDQLRKVPQGVDESFEENLGMPYFLAPSPKDDGTYADHYFNEFLSIADELKVEMKVVRSNEAYQSGEFVEMIEAALDNSEKSREIIEEISHRQLPLDWSPVQVLSDDNKLVKAKFLSIDKDKKTATFETEDGEIKRDYSKGQVKLDWRLDWPARWAHWTVHVEPFGRDHATKGGSYDTGKELVREIFNAEAPMPYPYEFINRKGETKKLSASSGDVITPNDAVKLMPGELLRYFVLKSRPTLQLFFDTGQGFGRLYDEFRELPSTGELDAQNVATLGDDKPILSEVPFMHLVTAWQSSNKDEDKTLAIISRSEHGDKVADQNELIRNELKYIDSWLETYAPDEVKFSIHEKMPSVDLSDDQKSALSSLADRLEGGDSEDGQWFHEQVYETVQESNLEPKDVFSAIYLAVLGQDFGPKAGWFLSTLDKDFVVKRLRLES